jgi:hypothetical protein
VKINDVVKEEVNQTTGTPETTPATPTKSKSMRLQPGWFKRGLAGAKAGWDNARLSHTAGGEANKKVQELELKNWQTFLNQRIQGLGGKSTPEILQQAAAQYVSVKSPYVDNQSLAKAKNITNVTQANQFVLQMANLSSSNYAAKIDPRSAGFANPETTPATPTKQLGLGKRGPAGAAPAGQELLVPGAGVITKRNDGMWQDSEGAVITLPREIAELERLAVLQRQNAAMSTDSAKKTLGLDENVDLADVLWHKMKRAR